MSSSDSEQRTGPFVIDTSVAISLVACGIGPELIKAACGSVVFIADAHDELDGARSGDVRAALALWNALGLVAFESLSPEGFPTYEALITGDAADTLDDGEAATIAHALDVRGIAVLDEKKARRIAAERFPQLPIASSAGLMLDPDVARAVGSDSVIEAVHRALVESRMRVPPELVDAVVGLIGLERAASCRSLPATARLARHENPSPFPTSLANSE